MTNKPAPNGGKGKKRINASSDIGRAAHFLALLVFNPSIPGVINLGEGSFIVDVYQLGIFMGHTPHHAGPRTLNMIRKALSVGMLASADMDTKLNTVPGGGGIVIIRTLPLVDTFGSYRVPCADQMPPSIKLRELLRLRIRYIQNQDPTQIRRLIINQYEDMFRKDDVLLHKFDCFALRVLEPELGAVWKAWRASRQLKLKAIDRRFKRILARQRVNAIRYKDRLPDAIEALRNGVELSVIAKMLGGNYETPEKAYQRWRKKKSAYEARRRKRARRRARAERLKPYTGKNRWRYRYRKRDTSTRSPSDETTPGSSVAVSSDASPAGVRADS